MSHAFLEEWLASPIFASSDQRMEIQLSEMVIHHQDIRRTISPPRSIPWDAVVEVLGFSTSAGFLSVNQALWRLRGLHWWLSTDHGLKGTEKRSWVRERLSSWR